MIEIMKKNFRHCKWANGTIIDYISEYSIDDTDLLKFISHILAAEKLWLKRLESGGPVDHPVWPQYDIGQCRELFAINCNSWENYLDTLDNESLGVMLF